MLPRPLRHPSSPVPTPSSVSSTARGWGASRPWARCSRAYASWPRRWARGRLPLWARDGLDTSDLVQDALHGTLARISTFRSAHAAALRGYLRRAVENRIGDHQRRALFRLSQRGPSSQPSRFSDEGAPQLQQLIDKQTWARYLEGLERLTPRHRRLVVGRVECGYSYRQLALIERLSTPDAARMAFGGR